MAITIVQTLSVASGGSIGSVQSSAFGSSVTAGNTIVVAVAGYALTSQTGALVFSDTAGNTYTGDIGKSATGTFNSASWSTRFVAIYRVTNCLGGASFKITGTFHDGANNYLDFAAVEVSGLDPTPLDGAGSSLTGTASPATTGAFNTSNANDLIVLSVVCDTSGTITGPPTNFTRMWTVTGSGAKEGGEGDYQIVSSTQTGLNPSWATPGSGWAACAIAYKQFSATGFPSSLLLPMMGSGVVGGGILAG